MCAAIRPLCRPSPCRCDLSVHRPFNGSINISAVSEITLVVDHAGIVRIFESHSSHDIVLSASNSPRVPCQSFHWPCSVTSSELCFVVPAICSRLLAIFGSVFSLISGVSCKTYVCFLEGRLWKIERLVDG